MIVRELVTKLGFKVDEAAIKRANAGFKSLSSMALGVSAAVAAIGGSLFAMVKSVANVGDEAVKTAQKVGVSVEGFQRLAYAAKLSDVSNEQLANGLKFLSRNLIAAAEGGKQTGAAFKQLGINPKKVKDNESLLAAIADQFQKMPDGAKKTALAMDIFGRAGGDLIPLLNSGGKAIREMGLEAEAFGIIIDEATAKSGEEFNDQITRMQGVLAGLKNIIGSALLPYFKRAIDATVEWFKANGKMVKLKVREWVDKFIAGAKILFRIVKGLSKPIRELVDKLGGVERVAKLAALAIAILYGVKTLKGISDLAFGIAGIVTSLFQVATAGGIANLAVAALPVLITAIAIAIGILAGYTIARWDEVKAAFIAAGQEIVQVWTSLFTALFNFLIENFKTTARIASGLLNPFTMGKTIEGIKSGDAFAGSRDALSKLSGSFDQVKGRGVGGINPLADLFRTGVNNLAPTFGKDIEAIKNIFDSQSILNTGPRQPGGSAPKAAPGTSGQVNSNNKTVTINPRVEIKVSDATEIKKQLDAWFGSLMRTASQATNSGAT